MDRIAVVLERGQFQLRGVESKLRTVQRLRHRLALLLGDILGEQRLAFGDASLGPSQVLLDVERNDG